MASCVTVPCADATECPMVGGCQQKTAPPAPILEPNELRDDARALAGGKPRPSRDPHKIKRNRKALTP